MSGQIRTLLTLALVGALATPVWAGAPLKGVDIKLGKNPGGSPAARTVTDDKGEFSFGVMPKGSYSVIINFIIKSSATAKTADSPLVIVIHGAVEGAVKGTVSAARKSGSVIYADRMAKPALTFTSDGTHPITGNIQSGN